MAVQFWVKGLGHFRYQAGWTEFRLRRIRAQNFGVEDFLGVGQGADWALKQPP